MTPFRALLMGSFFCAAVVSAAVDVATVERVDGQYRITAATYSAVVPATGLLSLLKVGDRTFVDKPLALCIKNEWNPESRQNICATISQPEPGVLLCEGAEATLRYRFGADSLKLSLTPKPDGDVQIFVTLSKLTDQVWTDGYFLGPHLHAEGARSSDYSIKKAKIRSSGQVMTAANLSLYGALNGSGMLRLEAGKGQTFTTTWTFGPLRDEDRALFAVPSVYRDPLAVLSPLDYQVFQRQTAKEGRIRIAGRMTAACDRLEYRFSQGDWQPLPVTPVTGGFATEFKAPSGGWYRCELRALKDGAVIAAKVIEHIGVGEVFVAAGQSNSTNNGEKKLAQSSGMVSTYSGEGWRLADDPQPGCYDNSRGGSFYPPLGDMLYEQFKVPIAFAVTGQGGSSVAQWQTGGDLFNWMEMRIQQLGPQGFRMVLWHQGEADGPTPDAEHYNRIKAIIEESNLRAGWSFPWMVAQVGHWQTRKAKVRLWADGIALEGPDSDALAGENRISPTNCHFSETGLKRHAALWFDKLSPYLQTFIGGEGI